MKKSLISSLVAMSLTMGVAGVANAAGTDWSGWYGGLNVGVAPYSPTFGDPEYNHSGGNEDGTTELVPAIGGQVGYNLQNGSLVYGVELDATLPGSQKSEAGSGVCGATACNGEYAYTSKLKSLWSLRARAGVAVDKALIYGTLGYGQVRATHAYFDSSQAPDSPDTVTASALVAGAGVDYALSDKMSARFEGLYYFSKKKNVVQWGEDYSVEPSTALLRVGMNYKF